MGVRLPSVTWGGSTGTWLRMSVSSSPSSKRVSDTRGENKKFKWNQLFETSRFLPSSRSQSQSLYNWEKTFYTEDKTEVERTLQGLGYNVEWRRGDILHYWYVMTSIRRHPTTGEMVWCNQVSFIIWHHSKFVGSSPVWVTAAITRICRTLKTLATLTRYNLHIHFNLKLLLKFWLQETFPSHTSNYDGSPLTWEQLETIRSAQWRHSRAVRWRRGDLLVSSEYVLQSSDWSYCVF